MNDIGDSMVYVKFLKFRTSNIIRYKEETE